MYLFNTVLIIVLKACNKLSTSLQHEVAQVKNRFSFKKKHMGIKRTFKKEEVNRGRFTKSQRSCPLVYPLTVGKTAGVVKYSRRARMAQCNRQTLLYLWQIAEESRSSKAALICCDLFSELNSHLQNSFYTKIYVLFLKKSLQIL